MNSALQTNIQVPSIETGIVCGFIHHIIFVSYNMKIHQNGTCEQ